MKKLALILVILAYSLTSFGISLNYFYCCGQLKSVSVQATPRQHTCKMDNGKGCCEDKSIQLKTSTDQQPTANISFDLYKTYQAVLAIPYTVAPAIVFNRLFPDYVTTQPPPLPISRNILFENFRI